MYKKIMKTAAKALKEDAALYKKYVKPLYMRKPAKPAKPAKPLIGM